ncbi:hypothetical protein ACFLZ9_01295, partial [Patescibacteria group bacterium]
MRKLGKFIIVIGKVDRIKNHISIIKALKKLPDDFNCVMVGKKCDFDFYQQLNRIIKNNGLEGRVF